MSTRPRIATCVHCRQMKVRCDAKEVYPAPCSRCRKHQLHCFIDPSFQRTAKRKRADALEQELREMKAAAGSPANATSSHSQDTSPSQVASTEFSSTVTSTYPEYSSRVSSSVFSTQRLGDVEISPQAIEDIINCFFTTYHIELPILPDLATFVRGYDRSPILFWVIIAIGSRNMESYCQYHSALEPHIRILATSLDSAADHPLGTVQALLLLCWWPFPFYALRNEPSWTYSGLAIHTALRFGIHRPEHFSDFVYNDRLDEAGSEAFRRAWTACFIVNQTLSSDLGIPATATPDATIVSALQSPRLPIRLEQHLKIAYRSYNICQTLGNNESTASGLLPGCTRIVTIFEKDLLKLEAELACDTPSVRIALSRVKLQLYSFSFTADQDLREADHLAKAGTVAVGLIQTAYRQSSEHPWPAIIRTSVVYATHIILRLLTYPDHLDRDLAMNTIRQSWELLNARSELENDSWARVCEIIAYLSRTTEPGASVSTQVRSRMSANVTIDSVWRARGRFSDEIRSERPQDYTEAAAVKDLINMGLDLLVGSEWSSLSLA